MENENIKLLNKNISSIPLKNTKKRKFLNEQIINNFIYKFNNFIYKLLILLLIINIILIFLLTIKNTQYIDDIKYNITNNTGNYSLYDIFKYPQITFLIPNIEDLKVSNNLFKDFIDNLMNQKLKDIQILLSFSTIESFDYYNSLNNYTKLDKKLKLYYIKKPSFLYHLYYLIEKSKGKFDIIIDKIENFDYNEIEGFYNMTKGKVNSIFSFLTNNGNNIYLIKSKILKSLLDRDFNFKNYSDIINYLFFNITNKIDYISIAFCPDNYYTTYTYVAMISILNTKFYYTYVSFYLIITDYFEQKNIDFLILYIINMIYLI